MQENPNDEELLNRWFEGESQAFEIFFVRHSRRIVFYCVKKGLSKEDAEDVTQRIFLKLSQCIHQYEKGRPALPWLYTIVMNEFRDYKRTTARYASKIEHVELETRLHATRNGENQFDVTEAAQKVLSPESTEVLKLRVIEERSFADVARETGRSEVATRKIFSRAIQALRNWVKGKSGGEL